MTEAASVSGRLVGHHLAGRPSLILGAVLAVGGLCSAELVSEYRDYTAVKPRVEYLGNDTSSWVAHGAGTTPGNQLLLADGGRGGEEARDAVKTFLIRSGTMDETAASQASGNIRLATAAVQSVAHRYTTSFPGFVLQEVGTALNHGRPAGYGALVDLRKELVRADYRAETGVEMTGPH